MPVPSPRWPPPADPAIVERAAAEAARLLAALPDRWAHTRQVADSARWAAVGVDLADRPLLIAAAYLHDIGYSRALAVTGFHPLDGARHLAEQGADELARLVAHHSGAAVEARHRGLTDRLARFARPHGAVADALDYADATSGPTGESVDPGPRFEEILDRHGADSVVARSRGESRIDTYAAVVRTLRRADDARPRPGRLAVTPVQLGFTTLVRFQGVLDESSAEQATAVLRDVLDRRPHAAVCDLALLTRCDQDGVRVLSAAVTGPVPADPAAVPVVAVDPPAAVRERLEQWWVPGPPPAWPALHDALAEHCQEAHDADPRDTEDDARD
ncbi:HD domain-containing protein [Nakamurella endophytica]|uniref:HD domain-containing protein n=1 Tax=Nakamurella endophytica TaxID=1748367 RepID=A0A917T8U0_9ACTN|nr:HD domain-containing protein [Nakamurella endophytica]GGM13757.1 hypothetical protein GCM10011594_37050 [Nakamurella endophytica]